MPPRSIFLCYRRDDTQGEAGRLQHSLEEYFSTPSEKAHVFMDEVSLDGGTRWRQELATEINRSDAVLVLIGRRWLTEGSGRRRARPEVSAEVRHEISTALDLGKFIVPILVNGGQHVQPDQLPGELAGLAEIHELTLANRTYDADIERLCAHLNKGFSRPAQESMSGEGSGRETPLPAPVRGEGKTSIRLGGLSRAATAVVIGALVVLVVLTVIVASIIANMADDADSPTEGLPPQPILTPPTIPSTVTATPGVPATTAPGRPNDLEFTPKPGVELVGSPTFDSMRAEHRIRIATGGGLPGLDDQGGLLANATAFDFMIEKLIATGLGFPVDQIEHVVADTGDLSTYVSSGAAHLAISTYTGTVHRHETISFAGPYFQAGQSILVRRNEAQIVDKETLRGRTVCTVEGSTGYHKLEVTLADLEIVVESRPTIDSCVDALLAPGSNLDAVSTDDAILAGYQQLHLNELKIVGESFSVEPWGVGLPKGDRVMCEKINDILTEALADGTWDKIFDATLGRSGIAVHRPTPGGMAGWCS